MKLKSGVPTKNEYRNLITTPFFQAMERYSNDFLREFDFLRFKYKWGKDPFHQWSRQWEYPYVFAAIKNHLHERNIPAPKILDAGSGFTFFPYYLSREISGAAITCCDYDHKLLSFFETINKTNDNNTQQVEFQYADLHALPFESSTFDVVYSISVLEHTKDYASIIREFARVTKPGGALVITFDVALDGVSDISPQNAEDLLLTLSREFDSGEPITSIKAQIANMGLLTTDYALQLSANILPWKYPLLSLIKSSVVNRRFPNRASKCLMVYCDTICKNEKR